MKQRLQKILSMYGVASRRTAERLIAEGRVKVNGQKARLGDSADPDADDIEVGGRPLAGRPEPRTVLLHKPRGVVCTLSDEKGRRTVRDLLPPDWGRLAPVGRLDIGTEGLLLLTNDGALHQKLTHPSHGIEKEYHVWIEGDVPVAAVKAMSLPMVIEGRPVQPARVSVARRGAASFVLSVTIHEGRHHQVRLMCAEAGLAVNRLKRVRLGFLTLEGVPYGSYRELKPFEIKRLHQATHDHAI
ncbi:MAG: rRNA pseudouridine synthase [Oscillospiraceae bacterium]|nr:rRNA pseudouridine synthase [Oscillospiraceae bacterium]